MDEKSSKPRKPSDFEASTAYASAPDKSALKPRPERPADGRSRIDVLEGLMQRREVRIGMGILAMLVIVLGYLFVSKINEGVDSQANNPDTEDFPTEDEGTGLLAERPPTVVTASFGSDSHPVAPPTEAPSGDEPTYATDASRHEHGPPNSSYLPRRAPIEQVADAPPDAAPNGTLQRYGDDRGASANAAMQGKYGREPHALSPMHVEAPVDAADHSNVTANSHDSHRAATDSTTTGVAERGADFGGGIRYGAENAAARPSDAVVAKPRAIETQEPSVGPDTIVVNDAAAQREPKSVESVESRPIDAKPIEQATDVLGNDTLIAEETPKATGDSGPMSAVEAPRNRTYVTVDADTPASIAQSHYGDPRLAAALMAYNGVEIPAETPLTAGGEVLIPQAEVLRREFAGLIPAVVPKAVIPNADVPVVPSTNVVARDRDTRDLAAHEQSHARAADIATRTYEVRRGETVYDIARRELGLVSRWREIVELNQEQLRGDIDAIEPGMKLVLPEEGRSNVARQRGELLWR
jgi:hypothetical protein